MADIKFMSYLTPEVLELLKGNWASVDPATGSRSDCAITFWKGNKWVATKVLTHAGRSHAHRLQGLHGALRDTLKAVTITPPRLLMIEGIPPYMRKDGAEWKNKGTMHLHHSVAVVMCQPEWNEIVEVAPSVWQPVVDFWLNTMKLLRKKSDYADSILIGVGAMLRAGIKPEIPAEIMQQISGEPIFMDSNLIRPKIKAARRKKSS